MYYHRIFAVETLIMEQEAWYKDWFNSHYYHLLYQHRNEEEANAFIETLVHYLNPAKGSKMLDVACGKGRHSIALADMGFDVTGIDLSAESIAEAKLQESATLHFFEHDMRLPFQKNHFQFAFNFFTSFGYFNTRNEHDESIRSIANSLCNGGVLVIDYLNVDFSEKQDGQSYVTTLEDVNFYIKKWHDEQHFYKQINISDAQNQVPRYLYTERVAKFYLSDFSEMLKKQGLEIEEVFGNYRLQPFEVNTSPRLIILARKS